MQIKTMRQEAEERREKEREGGRKGGGQGAHDEILWRESLSPPSGQEDIRERQRESGPSAQNKLCN